MITPNDFKTGLLIKLDNEIYQVISFQHTKIARRGAFIRTRLKNLKTGAVLERNFDSDERIEEVELERRPCQYLYTTDEDYFFMDNKTFEQFSLRREVLGDDVAFLKEGEEVTVLFWEDKPWRIEIPKFVSLKVVETEPDFRGDTASGSSKPARLENGLVIQVPFFIKPGDLVKVDTRTKEYIERL